MAIQPISQEDFEELSPARTALVAALTRETCWFADTDRNMAGAVLYDRTDKDWNYVVLALHEDGQYRAIAVDASFSSEEEAADELVSRMRSIDETGEARESLFEAPVEPEQTSVVLTNINDELKRYFSKHPEKLYDLTPRKFEELTASILEDMGFDVELTQATRDGGTDIIAYLKNAICEFLTLVECKRYSADNKVDVGIIREVMGVHHIKRAAKSMIITTSFFSPDAKKEARHFEHQLDLRDYDDLKLWLGQYR